MVVKTYTCTFVGKLANCDLTSNWAPLKSVAGQRLYTIQRRRPVSANQAHDQGPGQASVFHVGFRRGMAPPIIWGAPYHARWAPS